MCSIEACEENIMMCCVSVVMLCHHTILLSRQDNFSNALRLLVVWPMYGVTEFTILSTNNFFYNV